ncbi:hypothetical protein HMPREF9440_00890 [Sutterella parvirubra YIT 11816]|uniref:Uncharacterized protein n=1 Tax=Sutterella parvirubra YIT 11816 TaxID=762967 RepID=H3KDS9_9BURK|nr:hypothetical protein HMPREF9440_00890 [Sutterella parvirubra YIT 11816]
MWLTVGGRSLGRPPTGQESSLTQGIARIPGGSASPAAESCGHLTRVPPEG